LEHPATKTTFLEAVKKKNSDSKSSPAPGNFYFLREKDFFHVPDVPNVPLHPFGGSANKQSPTGEHPATKTTFLEAVKKKNSDGESSLTTTNFSFLREKVFSTFQMFPMCHCILLAIGASKLT